MKMFGTPFSLFRFFFCLHQNSYKTAKTQKSRAEVQCTVASSIKQTNQNRNRRIEGGEAFLVKREETNPKQLKLKISNKNLEQKLYAVASSIKQINQNQNRRIEGGEAFLVKTQEITPKQLKLKISKIWSRSSMHSG